MRTETEIVSNLALNSLAPVELARQLYEDFEKRGLVIFGSGKKSQRIAELFRNAGMIRVELVSPNRGPGALRNALNSADILLTCLPDTSFALQRNHVAELTRDRERRLVIIDTEVPRNVDPAVCELPGVVLQNIDQLNEFVLRNAKQQHNLVVQAEKILRGEAAGFLTQMASEQVNPMVAEFRSHLGRVCSEQLERVNEEYGPFTEEQHEVLNALAERGDAAYREFAGADPGRSAQCIGAGNAFESLAGNVPRGSRQGRIGSRGRREVVPCPASGEQR